VRRFPAAEELAELLRDAGFADVWFRRLGGSIVALHVGTVRR
jgi:ubiquinone/menaquinone biosynthesis C-methylase UbiE